MSGLILDQEVVEVKIDFGGGFIPFPCVTQADLGETSVERVKTTCFSSPPGEPEYVNGEIDVSEGSITYNLDIDHNVHKLVGSSQRLATPIGLRVTLTDGVDIYSIERQFLIMGVSEPFNLGEVFVATMKIQATGPATRSFVELVE